MKAFSHCTAGLRNKEKTMYSGETGIFQPIWKSLKEFTENKKQNGNIREY
ncbi:hypothetical protein SAMN06265377_0154 [Flagellimonas pacifica]|uniref:Uncharacterized protein n=1 Tax=Flagellimonas pacifica TaxID=1247520 RepID=A0A285MBF7_9FLAO|nr:hypothetical protein SAMN06265377_0154 [Allomuricauda parva]